MGALTLKSFPFELRGWDIEKLESIDPTDSFGSNTRVYINKNKIIQIEPDFDNNTSSTWLTDKGRQFFDGILTIANSNDSKANNLNFMLNALLRVLYVYEHCLAQQKFSHFFTIIFENLDLEILSLLTLISQKYPFMKIRRADKYNVNNNLEANLQLNLAVNKAKLQTSTFCLLIANNPKHEGHCLNLALRQRLLKGNFKCFLLGPLTNLTFPTHPLGSNTNTLKTIIEGNNLICQEIKSSFKPMLIFSAEFLKRHDGKKLIENLQQIKNSGIFNSCWNGLNILSPSLHEVGNQLISKFAFVSPKDLDSSSSIYFCSISANNTQNIKKIIKLKLINFNQEAVENLFQLLFIDHNIKENSNFEIYKNFRNNIKNYCHIPSNMFYENNKTFINTEGYFKRTTKTVFKNKTKSSWQVFRRILKHLNNNKKATHNKKPIIFNFKNLPDFKTYTSFHYQATKDLTNLSSYLNLKNESFIVFQKISNFKQASTKTNLTKQKYWLDDFYNGGKDEYSYNSLVLSSCSKLLRAKSTNFF